MRGSDLVVKMVVVVRRKERRRKEDCDGLGVVAWEGYDDIKKKMKR